jgi:hypothetical protein
MPCPTCGHTTHSLGVLQGRAHYWCPRCGTLRSHCGYDADSNPIYDDGTPKLVERCRQFEKATDGLGRMAMTWHQTWARLGIAESINVPADRPE